MHQIIPSDPPMILPVDYLIEFMRERIKRANGYHEKLSVLTHTDCCLDSVLGLTEVYLAPGFDYLKDVSLYPWEGYE